MDTNGANGGKGAFTPSNTSSWNGATHTLKNHPEPMDISSPSPVTYNEVRSITYSNRKSTPKPCTMNGNKNYYHSHTTNNNSIQKKDTTKIEIDLLTLKAMQTEFFGLDHHHKSVHDIVLALADSDVVMLLHTQNRIRHSPYAATCSKSAFSAVKIHEQEEEARENRIKMCEKALKDSLMRISGNVTIIEDWREFEKMLEDILVLPREDEEGEAKEEMKEDVSTMHDDVRKEDYLEALTHVAQKRGIVGPHEKWRQVIPLEQSKRNGGTSFSYLLSPILDRRINEAQKYIDEKNQAMEDEVEALMKRKEEEKLKAQLDSLLRPLDTEEKERVNKALYGIGPQHEIIAEMDADTVTRQSVQRLRPKCWLNDEIIHFYFSALSRRNDEINPKKRCHFFKSFFITKLLEEGNGYKYSNVKRWSKKVPGKDIFALSKILFPVNIGNMHWATACIFMQEKTIRFYDSMGGHGTAYLEGLLQYLKDEWRDKKKCSRDDWDEWQLVGYTDDIPQQQNGFDCGVFTCFFADFLSREMPLCFTQQHVTPYREHIALSILNGKAL